MPGSRQVVLCDDDNDMLTFLTTMFEVEGWDVTPTSSGVDCLEIVDVDRPPGVIVLDQVMPGLTGLEVASSLREDGLTCPIVLFAGRVEPWMAPELERLGVLSINKLDSRAVTRVVRVALSGAGR